MNFIRKILSYPLHPYLVCFYCLTKVNADLHISTHYWTEILGLLVFFFVLTAILQFLFKFIWSSNTVGSIVLSIFLFINFFLLPIHKTINYTFPPVERVRHSFVIVMSIGLLIAFFLLIKKKKNYTLISQYLTILLLIFSGLDIFKWISDTVLGSKELLSKELIITHKINNYNIYLIVPDGYASNENLLKYWYFDNSIFVNNLKSKGFFVAKNPHSNYRYTVQSVSSMLGFNYYTSAPTEQFMEARISNNAAMQFLNAHKYKCNITDFNEHHYLYNPDNIKINIKTYLYHQSAIYFLGIPLNSQHENSVNNIAILKNIFSVKDTSPVFHYIHSMITHSPFKNIKGTDMAIDTAFLNVNGVQICENWSTIRGNNYRTAGQRADSIILNKYLEKIKETNTILQDLLDESWSKIKENSIVIVMSDHGFRCLNGQPQDYKSEAYQNFCAVYFPDQDYSSLTDTITPINVLRMTINKAMGTSMPYLSDKTNL